MESMHYALTTVEGLSPLRVTSSFIPRPSSDVHLTIRLRASASTILSANPMKSMVRFRFVSMGVSPRRLSWTRKH